MSFVLLFAVSTFSATMVFAQNKTAGTPTSGTSVGLEHDPEGIKMTPR